MVPAGPNEVRFRLVDPRYSASGAPVPVRVGHTFGVSITTDVNLESVNVDSNRRVVLNGVLSTRGAAQSHPQQSDAVDHLRPVGKPTARHVALSQCPQGCVREGTRASGSGLLVVVLDRRA